MNPLPICPRLQLKQLIYVEKIAFLKGCGNYTVVHLLDGSSVMLSKNLGLLNILLPSEAFVRLNKTYLIRLKSIKEYECLRRKSFIIRLPNDQWTEVSRRRVTDVKQKLTT
jgi:DNA-binding LytR/AlgR family response regulator